MAKASKEAESVDAGVVRDMLEAAYGAIRELGEAKVGDKTLVDTLDPAAGAMRDAVEAGKGLDAALDAMVAAAEAGWKSTEDLVAKIGRSARLGERSRGVLDAGATSCFFMLRAMAEEMKGLSS